MSEAPDAVLMAVAGAAMEATGAAGGRVVVRADGGLRVVAAVGEGAAEALGSSVPDDSEIGYVLSSGQSLSLAPAAEDSARTTTVLCVPCLAGQDVVGALELVDKAGGDSFPLEEQRIATLLGGVAGAAIAGRTEGGAQIASPAELAGDLASLAAADPQRYAVVAELVGALLAHG